MLDCDVHGGAFSQPVVSLMLGSTTAGLSQHRICSVIWK